MIRFGVIGAGNIANNFCEAINVVEGASLYAIASRDIKKAEDYQKTYGIKKAYGSYKEMLEDPLLDCVYIATPHGLHYEHMMLSLEHDKHILCEKAFTLNESQAKAVFTKAKEKQCFVMEAMWTRFLPMVQTLKQGIDEGLIGDIKVIDVQLCFDIPVAEDHRVLAKHLGGGALLDVGIYPITFAHIFLGKPQSFETTMTPTATKVDGSNKITYYYENAIAYLKSSIVEKGDTTALIKGSKGYAKVPWFWCSGKAEIFDLEDRLIKTIDYPHQVNGFEYEIEEVVRCLNNHQLESFVMSHQTTLEMMRQMDDIRKVWNLKYPQED